MAKLCVSCAHDCKPPLAHPACAYLIGGCGYDSHVCGTPCSLASGISRSTQLTCTREQHLWPLPCTCPGDSCSAWHLPPSGVCPDCPGRTERFLFRVPPLQRQASMASPSAEAVGTPSRGLLAPGESPRGHGGHPALQASGCLSSSQHPSATLLQSAF